MAEEAKETKEATEEKGKGKKSKGKLIIILTVVLVILGGGGVAAYKTLLAKPSELVETTPEAENKQADLSEIVGTMYPLETFLVNIEDVNETRFLKTTLTLELDQEGVAEEVEKRIAQVRDTVLLLLSSKDFSDVRSMDGKFILREEILDQLNAILVTGQVKNVYFTEFVVQ